MPFLSAFRIVITCQALLFCYCTDAQGPIKKASFAKTLLSIKFLENTEFSKIKAPGTAYRIYTKNGNFRLQSILSEDDNKPSIIADEKSSGRRDLWQMIAYEAKDLNEDYVFMVSAFSGLNIHIPDREEFSELRLNKHKSQSFNNELFEFQPSNEKGWYYIRNRNSNMYLFAPTMSPKFYQNIFYHQFVIAPKHTDMVLRLKEGAADMVYDNRQTKEEEGMRSFAVQHISGLSGPGMNDTVYLENLPRTARLVVDGPAVAGKQLTGDVLTTKKGETQFKFEQISDNLYKIVLAKKPSLCVEVKNGDKGNKSALQLGFYTGQAYQQFYLFDAAAPKLKQVKTPDEFCKFRLEEAGVVDWKGR